MIVSQICYNVYIKVRKGIKQMLGFNRQKQNKTIGDQIIEQAIAEKRLLTTAEALYLNQEGSKLIDKLNAKSNPD